MPTSKSNDPNQEKKPSASRTGASGQAQRRQTAARRRELERRRRERARRKRNRMIFRIVSIAALVVLASVAIVYFTSFVAARFSQQQFASCDDRFVRPAVFAVCAANDLSRSAISFEYICCAIALCAPLIEAFTPAKPPQRAV